MLLVLVIALVITRTSPVSGAIFHESESPQSLCSLSTTRTASRAVCAVYCDRQGDDCSGFALQQNGECVSLSTECGPQVSRSATDQPIFSRKKTDNCRQGWTYWRGSCYRREELSSGLTFSEAQLLCKSRGASANLLSLNGPEEELWITNELSKPAAEEYIGLQRISGSLINVDGSSPSHTPRLDNAQVEGNGCTSVKETAAGRTLQLGHCSSRLRHFICEESQCCASQPSCPD